VTNGAYDLTARARDAAGNATNSTSVRVNVVNAAPSSLVAAYGFNEAGGLTAADSSGNQLNGTLSGATWTAAGRFGGALAFDGTNDWVTVADHSLLDLTSGMTVEAWVRPTSLVDWKTVVLKERPGGLAYALYASDNTNRPPAGYVNVAFDRAAVGSTALALNQWTHLATTYDGNLLKLYVNGTLVSTQTIGGAITTSASALRIGGNSVWGEYFAGTIDEVRLHNRALTASEIQQDMATPLGGGASAGGEGESPSTHSLLDASTNAGSGTSTIGTSLHRPPLSSLAVAPAQALRQRLESLRNQIGAPQSHGTLPADPTASRNRPARIQGAEHADTVDFLMRRLVD
jgi:hypothetical protein